MARERASRLSLSIEFVETDALEWVGNGTFNLVLDSGCLHGISGVGRLAAYKRRLLEWLAPDGQYVLFHFVRRHWLDLLTLQGMSEEARESLLLGKSVSQSNGKAIALTTLGPIGISDLSDQNN